MTLNSFKEQLLPDAALGPAQEQQLIDALKQERDNFKFTTDFSDEAMLKENPATLYSDEKIKLRIQEQEQLDQNCLTRAKEILSPDQLDAFAKFLEFQRQAAAYSMQMQARWFGAK